MEELTKISDILNQTIFSKGASNFSIKKAVAFGFWKDICGSRFANFSIPYDIKGCTLFVAVKNPQVMQELIFNKAQLLNKLKNYFLPLDIKIEEIRYDYKVWSRVTTSSYLAGDESLQIIEKEEIEEVPLTSSEKQQLSNATDAISSLSFLSSEILDKYSKNVINSYKAKKLRNEV